MSVVEIINILCGLGLIFVFLFVKIKDNRLLAILSEDITNQPVFKIDLFFRTLARFSTFGFLITLGTLVVFQKIN
jgi:hypothetical protein